MPRLSDFDLTIATTGKGYTVQVQAAFGAGELRPQPFALPLDLQDLPRAHRDVAQWVAQARVTRLAGSAELRQAREFGSALFERLFSGEVLASFRTSRAALPPGERLRLRLRLPATLLPLPWELLYDPRDGQFLALAPDLALVHYPEMTMPIAPLRMAGPLQLVVVLASPASADYAQIQIDRELRRIEAALKGPLDKGQIALDVIRGPDTLGQLRARLRQPAHALHVLCHGDLDTSGGEGVLIFEDADGAAEPINAELLRMQFQKQRGQTRLVLLNACLGALPASDDPFSSVGVALLRGGVPAVIAMQFEIAEDAAAELTRVFYAEVAAGTPVDLALTEARLHLYGRYPTRLDWSIPVLFLRTDEGRLFEVTGPEFAGTPGSPVRTSLPSLDPGDPRLLRARAAILTGRWPAALALYEELTAAFSLPESAAADLEQARREIWLAQTRAAVPEAETQGDWNTAVALLEQLAVQLPNDADVAERLRRVRDEQELAVWAQEAAHMAQQAEWNAVNVLLQKIDQRRPGYTHPTIELAGLRTQVQAALAYEGAVAQAEQGDWAGVIATLSAVPDEAMDDGLRALLDQAQHKYALQKTQAALKAAEAGQDWDQAVLLLEQLAHSLPDNTAVAKRLKQSRINQACAARALDAARLAQAADWTAVVQQLDEIEQECPGYRHPTVNLMALGRQAQTALAQQRALEQAQQADTGVFATVAEVPDEALTDDISVRLRPDRREPRGFIQTIWQTAVARIDKTFSRQRATRFWLLLGVGVIALLLIAVLFRRDPSSLRTARGYHTATSLNDGTVLVVGGRTDSSGQSLASAEIYDPATGTWRSISSLSTAREYHTATPLNDGTVLVVGGRTASRGQSLASAEIYDPATGTWRSIGSLRTARENHTATLLKDGTVLVVGGRTARSDQSLASAEIYDPATGTWRSTGSLSTARGYHTATPLNDGTVLVVGGMTTSSDQSLASAEIYDPATGTWRSTGSRSTAGFRYIATLLKDGTVLVVGGGPALAGENPINPEIYDPATGTWRSPGRPSRPRYYETATLLKEGTVLMIEGGRVGAEIYDPATGTWRSTGSLSIARVYHTATPLNDGTVLVVGGVNWGGGGWLASAEIYDPATGTWHSPGSRPV